MRTTKQIVKTKARIVDRIMQTPYGKEFLPTLRESGATIDGSPLFIAKCRISMLRLLPDFSQPSQICQDIQQISAPRPGPPANCSSNNCVCALLPAYCMLDVSTTPPRGRGARRRHRGRRRRSKHDVRCSDAWWFWCATLPILLHLPTTELPI